MRARPAVPARGRIVVGTAVRYERWGLFLVRYPAEETIHRCGWLQQRYRYHCEATALMLPHTRARLETPHRWSRVNGRRHGQMSGAQELASIARSKAVYSAIDSHALGGLKTGGVIANSTGRQTEV